MKNPKFKAEATSAWQAQENNIQNVLTKSKEVDKIDNTS
jgi:hypothetical protein